MDKVYAALAHIQVWMLYKIAGTVPVWFPTTLVFISIANSVVEKAKWTTAKKLLQLGVRFWLKFPAIGALMAMIPGAGDLLHFIADDDPAKLPPTLPMLVSEVRRARALNKLRSEPAVVISPTVASGEITTEVKKEEK